MADNFKLSDISPGAAPNASNPGSGTDLSTGDLRRKYNFGDRVSELNIAQDPFFRFVSKVAKKPCDDPKFKFTERRGSWHKRYAYVVDHGPTAALGNSTDAQVEAGDIDAGDTYFLKMGADYMSAGNRQNVFGQSKNAIAVGATGTQPTFFLEGGVVKVNYGATSADLATGAVPTGYALFKVVSVDLTTSSDHAILRCITVKGTSSAQDLCSYLDHNSPESQVYDEEIAGSLEPKRCYVVGNAHGEGTGYPETWIDQPFSTGYGQTQIWKTTCAMTNTARATVLKYEGNEWARVWREKLIEHKYDIEQSLLFGSQYSDASGTTYTQGAVDFIQNYGNSFLLDVDTKTQDSFLDDMSNYLDPRYNNSGATVYFCNTAVYNWLHKLGGYMKNNLQTGTAGNVGYSADLAITGKKMAAGVGVTTISTAYGDMNVVRNIHLDGTGIKMLGINMSHCAYRPLVGNGINRDTSVYVGVQTLENSGVDRRVDQILTEAGMEWSMPESHAVWL
jgi:hypothetical protein|tara:strand:+ start:7755 stop:9269 length:1515 start_codon:yes stop_codon:yes gene_type:complete